MSASPPKGLLGKIDHSIYRGERVLAGVLFLVMALVMFVSVVHHIFERAEGRLPIVAVGIFRSLGGTVDGADLKWWNGPFSAGLNVVLMFLLAHGVARTMKVRRPFSRPQALGVAAVGAALLWGGVQFVLWYWPNGLIWAPKVSLVCTLWVGFLGSSLATYERRHLTVEMAEKIWPKKIAPYIKALALTCAAGLCVFLLWLSWISLVAHYNAWTLNALTDVIDESLHVPRWAALVVITYTMIVMTARLLGQAVRAITHPEEGGGGELLPGLGGMPGADGAEDAR